jgi:hypothetical protein
MGTKIVTALACALALSGLAAAAAGAGSPAIGFAEDATKYSSDGGQALFTELNKLGTTSNRVAVFWDATQPATIQDKAFLDRMLPVAQAHNVQVVFAVYPKRALMAPTTPDAASAFCDYAVQVMKTYPSVRKVIIGNEPNQPRFWQPIWTPDGKPAAPAAMEAVLATCYDKLKAFDPTLDVIGVGLSPRGNDSPQAPSNSSLSPVRFIKALGDAYRASGRTAPLFDEWSWHCYPNVNTDPVSTGYPWPATGCVNADRVKQAIWDAFSGTGQPTFEEQGVKTPYALGTTLFGTLKMFIDEVGWQVNTVGRPGYTGVENVPTVDEQTQAQVYAQLVHLANCEPTLTAFHFFHAIDEADRGTGFQSGPLRATGEERSSAAGIQQAIAADAGRCTGKLAAWHHATTVVGAQASVSKSGGAMVVSLAAAEGFSFSVSFSKAQAGKKAFRGALVMTGTAPQTVATVKIPAGYAGRSLIVRFTAETSSARTTTKTLTARLG